MTTLSNATPAELLQELMSRVSSDKVKEIDWTSTERKCPHCGEVKFVVPGFGLRKLRPGADGEIRHAPQVWCRVCRGLTSKLYARAPRKYRSKHNR